MAMRITGMFSGLDTESIISELVSAKSTKVTTLKNEKTKLEWKQEAWQSLNSKIYSFYSNTLTKTRLESAFQKKKTTSSNESIATVVANGSAANGTQTLQVNKLAQAGYLTGAKISANVTIKNADGTTTTSKGKVTANTKLSDIDSNLAGHEITVKIGDGDTTTISLTADTTVSDLTNALKGTGLTASFDETNQRFFVNSSNTGSANDFTLSGDMMFSSNSGELMYTLQALGLNADASEDSYEKQFGEKSTATKITGQDAEIVLNGATFTSDKNSFAVNGLTINVNGTTGDDEVVTLNTAVDTSGIYDTIKSMLSEYNEMINEVCKLYNADSASKYDILTDEEKDSMTDDEITKWNDTIKGSLLRRDNTLQTFMSSVTSIFSNCMLYTDKDGNLLKDTNGQLITNLTKDSIVKNSKTGEMVDNALIIKNALEKQEDGSASGKKLSLGIFGVSTLNYFDAEDNEHNAYHIDGDEDDEDTSAKTDKLMAAISANPEQVTALFSTLSKQLYDKVDKLMASTDYSSIYKIYNDKQLSSEYKKYDTKIDDAQTKLDDYEDKWYSKFGSMETALAKLQSNSSAVTSMLGS